MAEAGAVLPLRPSRTKRNAPNLERRSRVPRVREGASQAKKRCDGRATTKPISRAATFNGQACAELLQHNQRVGIGSSTES